MKVGPLNEARFQVEFWHKTFVLKHVQLKSCTDVDCIFGWFGALKVWVSIYPELMLFLFWMWIPDVVGICNC
jgi:hypothetical protein